MEKPGKATGEPWWDRRNCFLGGLHQNGGKSHSRWVFQVPISKNRGFAVFLAAKPSILLRNSVLGLEVNQQW